MNIEATKNKIVELIQSQSELTLLFDHNHDLLVYSTSCPPTQRVELSERPTTFVFYNEEYHCYQLISLELLRLDEFYKQIQVKISVIVEVYLLSNGASVTTFLSPICGGDLQVSYSLSCESRCDLFCVELDLERVTREFPRLVERVSDAIVFVGEVLFGETCT